MSSQSQPVTDSKTEYFQTYYGLPLQTSATLYICVIQKLKESRNWETF